MGYLIRWRGLQNCIPDMDMQTTTCRKNGSRPPSCVICQRISLKTWLYNSKTPKTISEVRHIVNIYMHDYQIGMPRGQTGPMLCMASNEEQEDSADADAKHESKPPILPRA